MAICALTYFCSDEPTFWIDHQTGYAVDKLTADYTIGIGAEKVVFDEPREYGIVKIGTEKYMRCLLRLDSAIWITRPELLLLLKKQYSQ